MGAIMTQILLVQGFKSKCHKNSRREKFPQQKPKETNVEDCSREMLEKKNANHEILQILSLKLKSDESIQY